MARAPNQTCSQNYPQNVGIKSRVLMPRILAFIPFPVCWNRMCTQRKRAGVFLPSFLTPVCEDLRPAGSLPDEPCPICYGPDSSPKHWVQTPFPGWSVLVDITGSRDLVGYALHRGEPSRARNPPLTDDQDRTSFRGFPLSEV